MTEDEKIELIAKTMYGTQYHPRTWEELVASADRWRGQDPMYYFVQDVRTVDEYRKRAGKLLKKLEKL